MSFFNKVEQLFKDWQPVADVAAFSVAIPQNEEKSKPLPDQPELHRKQQDELNHANHETNAAQASPEQVTQDRVTEIIQGAVILAEQFKADRRAADLEEIEKAFNTVMFTERTGDESSFQYALLELESAILKHTESRAKAAA